MIGDLTTLANTKQWLGVPTPSPDDALLSRLISAQSRFIQSWLCRQIASRTYTDVRDAYGAGRSRWVMMFKDPPVSSVTSLYVDTFVVPQSPDNGILQPGWGYDSNSIWIADTGFLYERFDIASYQLRKGIKNTRITYTGGFLVLPYGSPMIGQDHDLLDPEAQTVPAAPGPYTITTDFTWLSDNGVWYANGTPLVAVASNPAMGQYSAAAGVYTFNAGDAGAAVLLSYSYVPTIIEQSCIELVSLRYKEKDRIGQISKHVGTETVSFLQKAMPDDVALALGQYRKTFSFA